MGGGAGASTRVPSAQLRTAREDTGLRAGSDVRKARFAAAFLINWLRPIGDRLVPRLFDSTPGIRNLSTPPTGQFFVGSLSLLDIVEGRPKQAFKQWLAERPQAWREGVEVVAMDGFAGFKTPAPEEMPDAVAVMDATTPRHVCSTCCRRSADSPTRWGHRAPLRCGGDHGLIGEGTTVATILHPHPSVPRAQEAGGRSVSICSGIRNLDFRVLPSVIESIGEPQRLLAHREYGAVVISAVSMLEVTLCGSLPPLREVSLEAGVDPHGASRGSGSGALHWRRRAPADREAGSLRNELLLRLRRVSRAEANR